MGQGGVRPPSVAQDFFCASSPKNGSVEPFSKAVSDLLDHVEMMLSPVFDEPRHGAIDFLFREEAGLT